MAMAVAPADAVALGDAVFGVIAQGDLSGAERVKRVRAAVKASVDAVEAVRDGSGVPADGGDVGDGDAADEGLLGLLRWRAGDAAEHPAAPGGTILHASVASGVVGLVELIAGLLPSLADERDASGESPMALLRSGPLATSERARNALDATQRLRRARIAQNVPGGGAGDGGEGGDIAGALPPVSEEPGEAAALVAAVAGGDGGELGRDVGVRLHNFALARLESGRVLSAQRLLRAADAAMLRAAPGAFLPDERAAPLGRLARVRRSLGDAVGADAADGEALRRWGDAQRAPAKPPKAAEVAPAALHVGVVKTVAATATATSAGAKATADPTAALTDVMALAHAHAAAVELEWEEDGGDGSPWRDWSFEPVADVEGEGDGDSSADGGAGRVPSLPYLPRIDRSRTLNAAAPARTAHVGEGQLRELIHELGGAPFSSRWPGNAVGGLLRVLGRRWNVLRRRRDGRGYMSRRWHRAPGAPPAWVAFRTGYFLPDGRRLLAVLHDSGAAPPTPEAPAQWRVEGFWARGCDALIAPHEDAPAALPWPDAAAAFEGGDEERAAAEARHRVIWWETTQIGWQVNKAGQRFVPSERCYYDINTFQGEAPLVLLSLPTSLGVYLLWAALGVPLLCACFCCVSRPLVAACSGGGDDAVDHCNASLWLIFLIPLGFFMPLWLWANLDDQDRAGVLVFGLLTLGGGIASYVTWSCSGQGTDDGGSPPAARGSDRHDSHTDSDDSETRADECRCGRPVAVLASCGHWFCAACVTRFGNRCGECGARFGFLVDSRGMVIASAPSRRRLDGAGRRPPFPPPSTETLADAVSARLQARRARSEAAAKPTPPQRRTSRSAKDAPRAGAAKEDNSCGVGRRRTLPGQSSAKRERVSRLEEIVRKESERLESKAAAAARRDAPTEDDPCCICLDAPRDMVLSCGHRLCLTCGDEENGLTQCPLCRADIEWRFAARSDEEMG
mmetsp:Transcript_11802/g.41319  ORF Transcript_11802/g.41319 Transcript_11802/m.41319 type:complete len:963 (-) Transcript_11802:132-3020(-)